MATPVEVPKLGNTVEECIVGEWRKRKGDTVAAGDVVVEIETDKTTFEITAPVGGTILDTFCEQGALVPVFTTICVIGEPGEKVGEFRTAKRDEAPAPEVVPMAAAPQPDRTSSNRLSPRARRFAAEHDENPAGVIGSGPGGRVLEADLRELVGQPFRAAAAVTGGAPRESAAAGQKPRTTSIRDKIARRMRESLATTAQYTLHASAEAAGLLALRARVKATPGAPDININHLVTFCAIQALLEIPALNAEYIDGRIQPNQEIHLGFACDTPRGLLVPVVRNAHALAIAELAARMDALAAQAVQGNILPDDLSGATFTVSNLGGLGIESFTPILNPPQVAILGVDAIQLKPVRRHGKVVHADFIGLSLTCDHQVIDGAPGARFLKVLGDKIREVESLCVV